MAGKGLETRMPRKTAIRKPIYRGLRIPPPPPAPFSPPEKVLKSGKLTLHMPDQMPHPETVDRRHGALAKAIGCDYEIVAGTKEQEASFLSRAVKFM